MKHNSAYGWILAASLLSLASIAFAAEKPAAQKPAAPKPDPILADLTMTPEAQWSIDGPGEQPPALTIGIAFHGKAASLASDYSLLRLESVLDENGKSYLKRCVDSSGSRVEIRIANHPAIHTIRELRGSVAIQTGGEHKNIILKNAFKTPGKPIQDDTLKALGIEVVASTSRKADWDASSQFREHVSIVIKWPKNQKSKEGKCKYTGFELSDDEGPIQLPEYGMSYDGKTVNVTAGCNVKVPPETQLSLKIHKGFRNVRVPFAFKNIPVPEVPEHLDKPAVPTDELIEAERISPDDPLVAGLKMTPENEAGALLIRLQGKPVEQASRFGELELDSALNENGNKCDLESRNGTMRSRFNDLDFQKNRPAACFWIVDESRPKKLRELRGSVVLRIGGQPETVVVKDILKSAGKPVQNETLKALGISLGQSYYVPGSEPRNREGFDVVSVEVRWNPRNPLLHAELLDAKGTPIKAVHAFPFEANCLVMWSLYYKKRLPEDAQLRLVVQKNSRKVRIPFDFKNIEIPPLPKEEADEK